MTAVNTRDNTTPASAREQMNIVVVGHVDHGKSTVIGRLLADTDSLPEGRLERVRAECRRSAKPFEYAFLLDALKDEQAQGITIDSARCFFRSDLREYIIIDAPGHIEFLKNMISGAARAEAGLLVIDAAEGVQENSRRHGYLVSMLGIRQLAVVVNKMDLVGYDEDVFEEICDEYRQFLSHVGIEPAAFIPVSAREGDAIVEASPQMPWYEGPSVLKMLDSFTKAAPPIDQPLRLPVQDIYKFTGDGDDRRIVAGRIETGSVSVGDEVVFVPSGKRSAVASVEQFNRSPAAAAEAGQSTGLTLAEQVYVKPGELLCRADQSPPVATSKLRVNLFWMSSNPMVMGKRYKLKLAGARVAAWLTDIHNVLDASDLTTSANRRQVERHDVAECTLETIRPIACDVATEIAQTGRFVLIDNYEIAGGGVVLEAAAATHTLIDRHVQQREQAWDRSAITEGMRAGRYNQRSALVVITGAAGSGKKDLGKSLEEYLFNCGRLAYYLGVSNSLLGIDSDMELAPQRDEYLRRIGEVSHLFTDAGLIFIITVSDLDDYELDIIDTLNRPNEQVVVNIGESRFAQRTPDLVIDHGDATALRTIQDLLAAKNYLTEYHL